MTQSTKINPKKKQKHRLFLKKKTQNPACLHIFALPGFQKAETRSKVSPGCRFDSDWTCNFHFRLPYHALHGDCTKRRKYVSWN